MIPGTHLQYRTHDQATHTRYVPTTKGNIPTKKKNTRHMYTAVYTLASDGHVGRSRVRNPAPLYFFSCFMFSFLCFPFFFIYTPMEVVSPVGMFVYTAVYTLAADVDFFIHPNKRTDVVLSVGW